MCCFHRVIQRAGKGTHLLFELRINYLWITNSFNNNKWLRRIPGSMCFVAVRPAEISPAFHLPGLFCLYRILSYTLSLGFELSKKLLSTEKFWHFFRRKREEPNSILFSLIHSTRDKYLFSCLIPHREASNKYVPAPHYRFRTVSNVISMQLGSPTCFASSSPSTSFSWLSTSLLTTLGPLSSQLCSNSQRKWSVSGMKSSSPSPTPRMVCIHSHKYLLHCTPSVSSTRSFSNVPFFFP